MNSLQLSLNEWVIGKEKQKNIRLNELVNSILASLDQKLSISINHVSEGSLNLKDAPLVKELLNALSAKANVKLDGKSLHISAKGKSSIISFKNRFAINPSNLNLRYKDGQNFSRDNPWCANLIPKDHKIVYGPEGIFPCCAIGYQQTILMKRSEVLNQRQQGGNAFLKAVNDANSSKWLKRFKVVV